MEAARGQAAAAADPLTSGIAVPSLVIGTARNSLWRVGPLGAVELIGCHHERPRALAPHPKDALCWASVGLDRQLLLWRAPLGAPVSRALLPTAANCVAFSHDGRFLATGHSDGTVRIHLLPSSFVNGGGGSWDGLVPTRRLSLVAVSGAPLYAAEVRAPDQPAPPPSVAFRAPRTEGGAVPGNCALEAVAFSSTGTSSVLVACGGHDRAIRVFELRISPRAPPGSHPLQAQGPVVAAAGGGDEAAALGAALGAALIGRLEPKCCCRGHGALVSALDFSADGAHLFSTSSARELFVWTLPSGARIMTAPSRLPADACCLYGGLLYGADRMGCFPQGAPRAALLQTAHAVREPLERCLDQSAPPPQHASAHHGAFPPHRYASRVSRGRPSRRARPPSLGCSSLRPMRAICACTARRASWRARPRATVARTAIGSRALAFSPTASPPSPRARSTASSSAGT